MDVKNFKLYTKEQAKEIATAFKEIDLKSIIPADKKELKGEGTFEVVMTNESVDRDGEIIMMDGWNFDNFMKNPVVLFGHDYWSAPVGAVTEIFRDERGWVARGVFARTDEAQKLRQLYDDGFLKTVSVGFIAKERDGNKITSQELLELSFVPVPSNPTALDARSKKAINELAAMFKTVVPKKETPMLDVESEWDATAAIGRIKEWASNENDEIDYGKYKEAFAWYDGEKLDIQGSYKLPHHDVRGDELVVNWRGVAAAMGALLGAQGGVDIPEDERRGVYDHLVVHYEQFEKEPPEFSVVEPEEEGEDEEDAKSILDQFKKDILCLVTDAAERLAEVSGEKDITSAEPTASKGQKAGRVLSAKTRRSIETAIESAKKLATDLQALIDQADGEAEPKSADNNEEILKLFRVIDKIAEKGIVMTK